MSLDIEVVVENAGVGDDLELPVAGIEVVSWSTPDEVMSRQTATSPMVGGEAELSSVPAPLKGTLVLRLVGTASTGVTAWESACSLLDTVKSFFRQRSYDLTVTIEDVDETYAARRADVSSPIVPGLVHRGRREVTLSIPVESSS